VMLNSESGKRDSVARGKASASALKLAKTNVKRMYNGKSRLGVDEQSRCHPIRCWW
jgi:hypothetical protein